MTVLPTAAVTDASGAYMVEPAEPVMTYSRSELGKIG